MLLFTWILFFAAFFFHFARQPRLKIIPDGCGEPYLIRFYLFWFFGWNLKLHLIIRSDVERELHDHPWSFWTYMISGGYWEETPINAKTFKRGHRIQRRWINQGTLRYCKSPYPHRLELCDANDFYGIQDSLKIPKEERKIKPNFKPAITLVLTSPRARKWGFYGRDKWIPHDQYQSGDC